MPKPSAECDPPALINRMKTSKEGLRLITQREGKILHVYRDSKGLPTAGIGHLLTAAEKRAMPVGTVITLKQCEDWLADDLGECEDVINGLGIALKQNEFDALVSLAFNIGVGNLKTGKGGFIGSTVVRRLKLGDRKGAAEAILLWNKPPEIQGRRRGEYHQFLTPYKTNSAAAAGEIAVATGSAAGDGGEIEAPASPTQSPEHADPPPVATTVEKKTVETADTNGGNSQQTVTTETQTPTVEVKKESPSTFTKIGAGIMAFFATVNTIGISLQAAFDRTVESITPRTLSLLAVGLGIGALGVWWYDRSAKRSNELNKAKIAVAANKDANTVELTK